MSFRELGLSQDLLIDLEHYDQYIRINHYILRDEGFFQNVKFARACQGSIGEKNLLLEHHDSFSKTQDRAIIEFIQKKHPQEYQKFWKN